MLNRDASTAKTLTLVAIIFQAFFFVIGIFEVIAVITLVSIEYGGRLPTGTQIAAGGGIAVLSLVFSVALLIGLLWIILDYFLIYRRLAMEKVKEAETPSIVLGIIQLIFGGLIPGILLIVAWVKIKDSLKGSKDTATPNQTS